MVGTKCKEHPISTITKAHFEKKPRGHSVSGGQTVERSSRSQFILQYINKALQAVLFMKLDKNNTPKDVKKVILFMKVDKNNTPIRCKKLYFVSH